MRSSAVVAAASRTAGADSPVLGAHDPRVARDSVAFAQHEHVARDQLLGRDRDPLIAANDLGELWQQGEERLGRPFGSILLEEAEGRVQQDHQDDRDAERRRAAREGQCGRAPEQEREEMDQLGPERPRELRAPRLRKRVASVLDSAVLGLLG